MIPAPISLESSLERSMYKLIDLMSRFIKRPFTSLSPKKSWEGFIGGGLCTLLCGFYAPHLFKYVRNASLCWWCRSPSGTAPTTTMTVTFLPSWFLPSTPFLLGVGSQRRSSSPFFLSRYSSLHSPSHGVDSWSDSCPLCFCGFTFWRSVCLCDQESLWQEGLQQHHPRSWRFDGPFGLPINHDHVHWSLLFYICQVCVHMFWSNGVESPKSVLKKSLIW